MDLFNAFNQSFDDNKVFKEKIEFANVYLSVQGHSLKFA
jgi:hypothetical protein